MTQCNFKSKLLSMNELSQTDLDIDRINAINTLLRKHLDDPKATDIEQLLAETGLNLLSALVAVQSTAAKTDQVLSCIDAVTRDWEDRGRLLEEVLQHNSSSRNCEPISNELFCKIKAALS